MKTIYFLTILSLVGCNFQITGKIKESDQENSNFVEGNFEGAGSVSHMLYDGENNKNLFSNKMDLIKLQHQFPCHQGVRVKKLQLSTDNWASGNYSETVLTGPFSMGLLQGAVESTYFGVSGFNDLMIVHKLVNDNQITGFNVILSMCEYPPIIVSNRDLSDFTANDGIVIDQDNSCSYSNATATDTTLFAAETEELKEFPVVTTFSKVNCNKSHDTGSSIVDSVEDNESKTNDKELDEQSENDHSLNIVAHGLGHDGVVWSSEDDPNFESVNAETAFTSDSNLTVKVLAYPSPGRTDDFKNKECLYEALDYNELTLKVGIRAEGSTDYLATHNFEGISVESSDVYKFSVPETTDYLVMDIMDVKFDWTCEQFINAGYDEDDPKLASYCPWWYVPKTDCFEIGVQFSTKNTDGTQ